MEQPDRLRHDVAANEEHFRSAWRRASWRTWLVPPASWTLGWSAVRLGSGSWSEWLSGLVAGLVVISLGLAGLALWQRRRPDDTPPVMLAGLRRRDRWLVYRAMWHRRPLNDLRLSTVAEEMVRKLEKMRWLALFAVACLVLFGMLSMVSGSWGWGAGQVFLAVALLLHNRWFVHRGREVLAVGHHRVADRS